MAASPPRLGSIYSGCPVPQMRGWPQLVADTTYVHEQFDNIVLIGNVIKNVPPAKIRSLVVREPSKLVEELLSSFFYFPC